MSRKVERSIEVSATPRQAFQALVEPDELRAWLLDDAQTDQRRGGTFTWVWSARLQDISHGTYLEFDPPHRLVTEEHDQSAPGPITSAYTFEDVGGGRTRIRVVNSGFGSGPDWDEAFERWREGVVHFLQELKRRLEDGFDRRRMPRLGVSFGPHQNGRQIEQVIDGSSAARAGLRAGDVIEALNGVQVADYDAIAQALLGYRPGDVVEVAYSRAGQRMSAGVALYAPGAAA